MYMNIYNVVAFLLENKGNGRAGDVLGIPELSGIFFGVTTKSCAFVKS